MKLNKKKILIFAVVCVAILLLPIFALYNDTCRGYIINYVISCMQTENLSVKVEGINKDITHVDKVLVKFSGNLAEIYNVSLERRGLLSFEQILIDKVNITIAKVGNKSEGTDKSKEDSVVDLKTVVSYIKQFRSYVKGLMISELTIINGSDKQIFNNLKFKSNGDRDIFDIKQDKSKLNISFDWSSSGSLNGSFNDIKGFSGTFALNALEKSENGYNVSVDNSDYKVNLSGSIKDKMTNIVISRGDFAMRDYKVKFNGNVLLNKKQANISTVVSLSDFTKVDKIPADILNNFQNITVNSNIDFSKSEEIKAKLEFSRDKKRLGDSLIVLRGTNLTVNGDISWINLKGFKLKTLNLSSADLKNFKADVTGDNLKVYADFYKGNQITINKFVCESMGGQIVLDKPVVLDQLNLSSSFSFKFDGLKFFENLFKAKGAGNVFFKNGNIGGNVSVDKLVNKAVELYNGKASGNSDSFKIDISSAKIKGQLLKGLEILKKKDQISVRSQLNNKASISLNGAFRDKTLCVSGVMKSKYDALHFKSCEFNFDKQRYKIFVEVSGRNEPGDLAVFVSPEEINLKAKNFSLKSVGKIFDQFFPEFFVDGSFEAHSRNNVFTGSGILKINKLLSKQSIVDINLQQNEHNLLVQGKLVNHTDKLNIKMEVPLTIRKDFTCSIDENVNIVTTITGNAHIENMFEFSDGISLKGEAKVNLKIDGSFKSPRVQGTAEYSKALIAIAGVVLKNGNIKIHGKGDRLIIDSAYFVDSYGKKAIATGDALVFFDKFPNLNTNIQLSFDNFRLFDTDAERINITGTGKMQGPLNDMLLKGKLKVPVCKLTFDESDDNDKYKDIKVINDVVLSKKKKIKEDFFSYDLDLDCSKVDIIGNIYNLVFKGNLHLGNYKKQATLSGVLELIDGKLDLFGKRMIFKKRKIEFFENYPFDPKMQLLCSRNLDSMNVFLEIINYPGDEMSLNIYSRPVRTTDEILSQMLFNKSTKDLSIGEAAQLAYAVQGISQKGYIFSILNTLQNIGIVDSLSFSTSQNESSSLYRNSQSSSDQKINVKAGKYIGDNVYISVNKKEDKTSFDVDLSVGSNTSLKMNTLGEVGVNWRFRY